MNEFWNLEPIYKGFDDPAFADDMAGLKAKTEEILAFAAALPSAPPIFPTPMKP